MSSKPATGLASSGQAALENRRLPALLVGVWQPVRGNVRLDGAALDQWSPDSLGRHIGYLPQDVELLAGTVAQNIARFEPQADTEAVIAAAKAAGVHDLIVSLPDGYDTQIGEQGAALSAGQAQRIALARALYRDPFLVVLDEPNSNLDADGEEALTQAILGVRERERHCRRDRSSPERHCRRRSAADDGSAAASRPSAPKTRSWPKCCNGRSRARVRSRSCPTAGAQAHEDPAIIHVQRAF